MEGDLNRSVGRLEGKVERMEAEIAEMKAMVSSMHETITAAKGSWRALIGVAAASAVITGGFFKILGLVFK
jgi:hypothetical protein